MMFWRLIDRYKNLLTVVWLKRTSLEGIPNILRLKKGCKVRRLARNFSKSKQRRKTLVAYLPFLEQMVENLARMCFKSSPDIRSVFWQVYLTESARHITGFVVPSGRVLRCCCTLAWKVLQVISKSTWRAILQ